MNKHTKGEWLFSKGSTPHFQCEVYSQETGQPIAVTYSDEGEHNARLIAAAPELLAALETLIEKCLRTADTTLMHEELYNAQQAIKTAVKQ